MAKKAVVTAFALLLCAVPALAQDFGVAWIDKILHETQAERGPVKAKPFDLYAAGGVAYYYDSNVFLEEDDEDSDSIVIPFANLRVAYSEPRFEIQADLLVNYNWYSDIDDADDDEERFYLHLRQVDARYSFDLTQIIQRASDPLQNTVFLERLERTVSNTLPFLGFDVSPAFAIEVGADLEIVRFEDSFVGDSTDNNTARIDGALVWRTPWNFAALVQGGYMTINYIEDQSDGGSPDVFGYYVRGGIRGEIFQRLWLDALVGYGDVESDFFIGTQVEKLDSSADAKIHIRYEATETFRWLADYTRRYSFGLGGDPWQLINRFVTIAEFDATSELTFKARFQYDHADSALGVERDYISLGGSATLKVGRHLLFDGGATWRTGETQGAVVADTEFDDFILHVGAALTY